MTAGEGGLFLWSLTGARWQPGSSLAVCTNRLPSGLDSSALAPIPGTLLAVAGAADHVTLIHLTPARPLLTLAALGQSPLCFSPDATALYVMGQYSEIHRWDLRRLREELAVMGLDWESQVSDD